jgi:hypothetical protein
LGIEKALPQQELINDIQMNGCFQHLTYRSNIQWNQA